MNKFSQFELEELIMFREFLRRCYKNRDVIEKYVMDSTLFPKSSIYFRLYYDCEEELNSRGIDIDEYILNKYLADD